MPVRTTFNSLASLQHWFQAVMTTSGGVIAGMSDEAASSAIKLEPHELDRVIRPSLRVSSLDRMSIYADAYFARLAECLREEFPALRHALGDDAFDAFVAGYLEATPSNSYTLANLGSRFADFLDQATAGGTDPSPENDSSPETDWWRFLVDLARLERLYNEVFDGPGDEGTPSLSRDAIMAVPPEQWDHVILTPMNSLRLIELDFPVQDYVTAVRKHLDPPIPERHATWQMVWRREYVVRRLPIGERAFQLLRALCGGAKMREALDFVATDSIQPELLEREVHDGFLLWTKAGVFRELKSAPAAKTA